MSRVLLQMMMRPGGHISRSMAPFASGLPKQCLTGQRRLVSSDPFKDYFPSYKRASRFVYAMVGLNVAGYGAWSYARNSGDSHRLQQLFDNASLTWQNVQSGRYWTVLTCAFSHWDFNHLLFNMFGLATFGTSIARSGAGLGRMMTLFVGSGVAGSAAWLYEHRDGRDRSGWRSHFEQRDQITHMAMGASGIVSGLAGAAACLAPFDTVMLFFVPIPMWLGVGLYAAFDFYYLGDEKSRIGHSAHLGGMAFGVLLYATSLRRFGGILYSSRWMR